MFAVQGIYDDGIVTIREPVPVNNKYDVVVTFLKPAEQTVKDSGQKRKFAALNRITGILANSSMTLEEARMERLKDQ
ncbi:MAG: hypothetical protein LBI04_06440 [Treponema sp.]|jgi:hypothetical protein|nr:hypothetical protein [Treponema sp.]